MTRPSPFIKWTIWLLAACFYFYEFLLRISPSVMVPELMESFGITASTVGVLSAFYLYAYAPMQLPVGVLMDRYGIKLILSAASIVCGLGALLFSWTSSLSGASFGRMLIGAGSSFAFVAMVYISSHWFSKNKRAFLIGIANSIAMLGASAGAGPLTTAIHSLGWQETIRLVGFFGILLGIAIYFVLQWDKRDQQVEKESRHKKSHLLESLKQVISKKSVWINAFAALFFYITTTAFGGLWGLSFVQTAYGVSKETAGYAMSMVFAGWLVGGPVVGLISDWMGRRTFAIRISVLGAFSCLLFVIYFTSISIYVVYVLLFLVGFFSSAELLNFTLAIECVSHRAKASVVAFTNFLISCGDAAVQPFIGFLLDLNWSGHMKEGIRIYATQDYQAALSCLPIALAISFVLLFFMQKEKTVHRKTML